MERFSVKGIVIAAAALLAVLFAIGWMSRVDPETKPYLNILGGGFMFNYRIAEVYYGFTAVVERPLPTGSIIEARFEDPGGGADLIVRQRVGTDTERYSLRSPPVRGVEAGKPYHVAIRVFDREERQLLWTHGLDFKSQISDTVVPDKPLTVGPGYTPNPEAGG
ncbi:hypothetical protein XW59_007035 [Aquamicrobium sp. LC103]|nr:hypothetical protein XW59_007035 [Aquamicrobium sp. LC103]